MGVVVVVSVVGMMWDGVLCVCLSVLYSYTFLV